MSNEITKQLLNEILILHEKWIEQKQENKEMTKKLKFLANEYRKLEREKEKDSVIFGSIILVVIFYFFVKILIAYLF